MAAKQVVPGVYTIPLGIVNAFLIDAGDLVLIDTGVAGSIGKILQAVQALGRKPTDLRHILVTHCHYDHSGSLAALKQVTGAQTYMHPADAAMIRAGKTARSLIPAPGLLNNILFRLLIKSAARATIPATEIEHEVQDGDVLPLAGGIRAIHAPGHCAGQLVFLWPQQGGVLFAGDAAGNVVNLDYSLIYEDIEEGKRSLAKIAGFDFEVACFGHGKAIVKGAAGRFRQKWGAPAAQATRGT